MGHGMFGGFSGGFSIIGLLIQLGLLYLVFRLVMSFIRNRQPAVQGGGHPGGILSGGILGSMFDRGQQSGGQGGMFSGGSGGASGGNGSRGTPINLEPADFNTFEQRLANVQGTYSGEELGELRQLVTPEMASYFSEEIAANARKGQINRIADVKLVRGDLAEAWREDASDYATVAMRFSLIDTMVDRASGRIVEGDPSKPREVTEVWTFVRPAGANTDAWKLSAIQQA
jgi:predicted lipid-binding transport protein (Tim44 family)